MSKLSLRQLKADAWEELQQAMKDEYYTDIDEAIHEIADGHIPCYYHELLEVLYSSNDLDFVDPYNPPHAIQSIYDIITWNLYNELVAYLDHMYYDIGILDDEGKPI